MKGYCDDGIHFIGDETECWKCVLWDEMKRRGRRWNERMRMTKRTDLPEWADSDDEVWAWFDAMRDTAERWEITEEEAEAFLEEIGFWGYER